MSVALQKELLERQKEVEAKDAELALLKDMVRARKADARTRELKQEVSARRRIRTDAPRNHSGQGMPIEISPGSSVSSSGPTPARRERGPATNMMQQLTEE